MIILQFLGSPTLPTQFALITSLNYVAIRYLARTMINGVIGNTFRGNIDYECVMPVRLQCMTWRRYTLGGLLLEHIFMRYTAKAA